MPNQKHLKFMELALEQAREAFEQEEVPVGAICVLHEQVISRARNRVEELSDATAHAELLAVRAASQALGRWRLSDVTLYVTLEPCVMCAGAIRLARVSELVYGAPDIRMGGCGSLLDLGEISQLGPLPATTGGVLEEECSQLMKEFFRIRRKAVIKD